MLGRFLYNRGRQSRNFFETNAIPTFFIEIGSHCIKGSRSTKEQGRTKKRTKDNWKL